MDQLPKQLKLWNLSRRSIRQITNGRENTTNMISEASSPNTFSKNYFDYLKTLIDQLNIENVSEFIELILHAREDDKTIFFIHYQK